MNADLERWKRDAELLSRFLDGIHEEDVVYISHKSDQVPHVELKHDAFMQHLAGVEVEVHAAFYSYDCAGIHLTCRRVVADVPQRVVI